MKEKISLATVYSLSHFIVDFVCAIFILLGRVRKL